MCGTTRLGPTNMVLHITVGSVAVAVCYQARTSKDSDSYKQQVICSVMCPSLETRPRRSGLVHTVCDCELLLV